MNWIKRFILFHGKRHPRQLGTEAVSAFLSHLAVDGKVSASTQNQALAALLFLYQKVHHNEKNPRHLAVTRVLFSSANLRATAAGAPDLPGIP